MKALWQRIRWHAQQMLAEDPRVIVLSLLTMALGLGVHAGLLNSMIRSRLAHRARTAPASMIVADRALAGAGDMVTTLRAAPSTDEAIAAFVRKLASKHNRTVDCARTRHRSARRVKSLKSAWVIDVPALPAEPAPPADPSGSGWTADVRAAVADADAAKADAAKTFIVITGPDATPDTEPEPAAKPATPANVERGTPGSAPAGTSLGTRGAHKPRCPDSK